MEHIDNFQEIITDLQKKKRKINLLIGNGFSMAYDSKIFSYNALADFVQDLNDKTLSKLFSVLKTKNFELIMEQLSTFSDLLNALGAEKEIQEKITSAHKQLKKSLLDAIKALHPEHVFKIPEEKMVTCATFLKIFLDSNGHLFSTNYDLLLYWVLMRQNIPNAIDGFGRELENPMETKHGKEPEWSELRWGPNASKQNVHYLHGALPLFDTGAEVIKEQYDSEGFILLENASIPGNIQFSSQLAMVKKNLLIFVTIDIYQIATITSAMSTAQSYLLDLHLANTMSILLRHSIRLPTPKTTNHPSSGVYT